MNSNNGLAKKILNKIEAKHLAPKPRWHFLLKNCVVWGFGSASLIIGGVTFSVIIFLLRNNDWRIYSRMGDSLAGKIMLTLPYFWILCLGAFILLAYYNVKHTKKGYRYSLLLVVGITVAGSMLLGGLLFGAGMGQAIDDVLGKKAPYYTKVFNRQMGLWSAPEQGRLAGMVIAVATNTEFLLLDLERLEWTVMHQQALISSPAKIEVGCPVRLVGKQVQANLFQAYEILPMGPGRAFMKRDHEMFLRRPGDRPWSAPGFREKPESKEHLEQSPEILEKYPEMNIEEK